MLKLELQSSRSVIPNRNNAPNQMAATRASRVGSKTEPSLSQIQPKTKKSGGVHPSLSKLQNILPLLPVRQDALLELLIEIGWPIPPGFN